MVVVYYELFRSHCKTFIRSLEDFEAIYATILRFIIECPKNC